MTLSNLLKLAQIDVKNKFNDFEVNSLSTLEDADSSNLCYVDQDKYIDKILDSKASGIFMRQNVYDKLSHPKNALIVENPHLCFALCSQHFAKSEFTLSNQSYKNVEIYPNVFIGKNVSIKEGSVLFPGVVIGDNVSIGQNCKIYPNVVIYASSILGDNVFIHAGSVIGSDGFGYAHTKEGEHKKIIHNGIVRIENDVEIGANTTIDRAVFGETIIKRGTKIDNLVQIGHNCVLGEHSIVVSQVGLAGSTTTGRNVIFGGQAGTGGHIHIGDFVTIAGRGAVGKNLPSNTKWGGHPLMELDEWIRFFVKLRMMVKKDKK